MTHQIPTAYTDIYKEFKILGAYVSVKRNRPSPISFGTGVNAGKTAYAQVEHQELWWLPSSGDNPHLHPRQTSRAFIVSDNWTTRYIPCMVPTATILESWRREKDDTFYVWSKRRCPWLPVDHANHVNPEDQTIPQQSLGYFYLDTNDLEIDVGYDVEVRFRVAFRYRKDLVMNDPNPDHTGAVNPNSLGEADQLPESGVPDIP